MKRRICSAIQFLLIVFALTSCTSISSVVPGIQHKHTFASTWSTNDESHWHAAICTHRNQVSDFAAHSDTDCDGKCDVCAMRYYDPSESHQHKFSKKWSSDEQNHWHSATCEHVDEVSDLAAHSDNNLDGNCDVCYTNISYLPSDHEHIFSTDWTYDSDSHWRSAVCVHTEEITDFDLHTDRDHNNICDVCGGNMLIERVLDRFYTNGYANRLSVAKGEYLSYDLALDGIYEISWSGDVIVHIDGQKIENGQKVTFQSYYESKKLCIYSKNNSAGSFEMKCMYNPLEKMATVTPNGGFASTISYGEEIFINTDGHRFGNVPVWLNSKSYLKNNLSNTTKITAIEEGWVYALTPISGETSNIEALENIGFEKVATISGDFISPNIGVDISVLGKKLSVGEELSCSGEWLILITNVDERYVYVDPQENSLLPPEIIKNPASMLVEHPEYAEYLDGGRNWQGMASMAKDNKSGRLWATWYSGGDGECDFNYVVVYTSGDDGASWIGPVLVVDPPYEGVRAFDPNLWTDPDGKVWLIWTQSYGHDDGRCGVWAITTENPESENPKWSNPIRFANGVGICDPIVLENQVGELPAGTWLFPAAIWDRAYGHAGFETEKHPNVYVSYDKGTTWSYYSSVPTTQFKRTYDENMIVENSDGTLSMYIRTEGGIEISTSSDGKSWTPSVYAGITQASARFWIGRLDEETLLAVYNAEGRSQMTAALSYDDGKTWTHKLLIYAPYSMYPDVHIDDKGVIYIITCENPYTNMKINMARLTKADIEAGEIVTAGSYLRIVINDNKIKE